MELKIPLQRRESQDLEFKSRLALQDLDKIVREVVGMLNASGGEVWIGLQDENDIAVEVEAIPDAHVEQRRLQDKLVDSVEPSPNPEEVSVEIVSDECARDVLRVLVQPNSVRKPYALVRRQARYYGIRIGARNRVMSHREVEEAFLDRTQSGVAEDPAQAERKDRFKTCREERLVSGNAGLWLGIQPLDAVKVPLDDDDVRDLLMHAEKTGNRAIGRTFVNPYKEPQIREEKLTGGSRYANVEVGEDGALTCEVDLDGLRMRKDGSVIDPFKLMEYPTSVLRLASVLYARHGEGCVPDSDQVLADLALFGVKGMELSSCGPQQLETGFTIPEQKEPIQDEHVFGRDPLVFSLREVVVRPDECAYRLYRRIYQAFGFREREIPAVFDRKSARLFIPD